MARIRTLKPEFWQDEKMTPLPDVTRLLFLGLISMADDLGRILYNPKLIEAMLFDAETDRSRDIRDALATLSRIGRVIVGRTASGQMVLEVANWAKHQRVDKPNNRAALPEIVTPHEVTPIRECVANDSRLIREAFALRPTTYDLRPTTYDSAVAADDRQGDAPVLVAERKPRQRRASPTTHHAPVKWPDWTQAERNALFEQWRTELGEVRFPQWIAALGPVFGRPPDGVCYDDLVKGYGGWLRSCAFGGSATRFSSPDACAKMLTAAARVARDVPDAEARGKAFDMLVHGRVPT